MPRRVRPRERRIVLEGAEELRQVLKEMPEAVERVYDKAAKKGVDIITKDPKRRAPVDTGALRNSLTTRRLSFRKDGKSGWCTYAKSEKEGGVRYSWHVETGTSKMAEQPFMRPAFDTNIDKVVEGITAKIKSEMKGKWKDDSSDAGGGA